MGGDVVSFHASHQRGTSGCLILGESCPILQDGGGAPLQRLRLDLTAYSNLFMLSGIASALDRHTSLRASISGLHRTRIDALDLFRAEQTGQPVHAVYAASLCAVIQGEKTASVGQASLTYGVGDGLFVGVEVPVVGCVTRATPSQPYLAAVLALDAGVLREVARDAGLDLDPSGPAPGPYVARLPLRALDALARLVALLDTPQAIAALAPSITREAYYWLLTGPGGGAVARMAAREGATQRIAAAVAEMQRVFPGPIRVEQLAATVGMSPSSFYARFREATAMTPLAYYQRLRLLEARRVLTTSRSASARDVAFQVGYQSPSQFSREYARAFGVPPGRDARLARA